MRTIQAKKLPKHDREQAVLLGLVGLYLKSGKPIGSQTLQENGFESLSSATIRNYFCKLETQGYLMQPHTSGGRIPTSKAFRFYADHVRDSTVLHPSMEQPLAEAFQKKGREIATLIHQAAEVLSNLAKCAVFISMPRFDQDFIQDIRVIQLDATKLLTVVITNFGLIRPETVYIDQQVDPEFLKRSEQYFLWRMNKGEKPTFENELQAKLAQKIYNEIMVRHVVGYANFPAEDVFRCGMSRLLAYPEFNDAASLVHSLGLLEDAEHMRSILRECCKKQDLTYWIGDDLGISVLPHVETAVIALPYHINQTIAGAVALLGPSRLPYEELFGLMKSFCSHLTASLTESVYQFKISFRHASGSTKIACDPDIAQANQSILLEDKTR